MNLLLLHESDRIDTDRFTVLGDRAKHLSGVLGVELGRRLRVGLLNGPEGDAEVVSLDGSGVTLRCAFGEARPRPATDLIVAVPRPKSLKKLLPEVASMGVDRIFLIRTWRVDKAYLSSPVLADPDVYRPLLHRGLMQGRLTHEPELIVEPRFKPFVEDRAPQLFRDSVRWVAHPTAETGLATQRPRAQRVAIAIGPEGGFVPYEVDQLVETGFLPVSMGPRTLRVETACIALLAQLALLRQL